MTPRPVSVWLVCGLNLNHAIEVLASVLTIQFQPSWHVNMDTADSTSCEHPVIASVGASWRNHKANSLPTNGFRTVLLAGGLGLISPVVSSKWQLRTLQLTDGEHLSEFDPFSLQSKCAGLRWRALGPVAGVNALPQNLICDSSH